MIGLFRGVSSAIRLLVMDDDAVDSMKKSDFRYSCIGLLIVSLFWSGLVACVWYGSFWLMNWSEDSALFVGMITAALSFFCLYRRSALSLVKIAGGGDSTLNALIMSFIVLSFVVSLSHLRSDWHRQEADWPFWMDLFRPKSKVIRVLILSHLWGSWSMLILPHFRRQGKEELPIVAYIARGCGPMMCAVLMGLLLGLSIGWFGYLPWTQLSISIGAAVTAILGGLLLAHRHGRMDRQVLLAANLLTQVVFLLIFHANRNIDLW